jgi:TRAP-type C4-dicarboxylate transport system permease small subunit
MLRHTIVFLFCIAMLPYCVTYVQQAVASGATSSALKLPMYYIQSAPLVGFLLLTVRVGQAWVREFKASWRGMLDTLKEQLKAEIREELHQEEEGKK